MRIKVHNTKEGLHPSELIATIETLTGPEELLIDARSKDSIEVGNPVAKNGRYYLVELPSETSAGAWRVWINRDEVIDGVLEAAE